MLFNLGGERTYVGWFDNKREQYSLYTEMVE